MTEVHINKPTVRERLKAETALLHDQIEKTLAILDPELSAARYDRIVEAFYIFHRHFEMYLAGRAVKNCTVSKDYLQHRLKVPSLISDLRGKNPCASRTPEFNWLTSPAHIMGAVYVIEGSTLGGQVISKHLEQSGLIHSTQYGCLFFQGYGPKTGTMWRNFLAELSQIHPSDADKVVLAARETFYRLNSFLEDYIQS